MQGAEFELYAVEECTEECTDKRKYKFEGTESFGDTSFPTLNIRRKHASYLTLVSLRSMKQLQNMAAMTCKLLNALT